MSKELKTEEEQKAHEKKMTSYLSLFSFLLVFLVGYYFGMHYASVLAAVFSLASGYFIEKSKDPLWKQVWSLASPYVMILAVGFINVSVIPIGAAGVIFTALGLHLKTLNQSVTIKLIISITAVLLASYGSLVEYPKLIQKNMSVETFKPLPAIEVTDLEGNIIKVQNLKGKVVVIDFWATWCPPCLKEFKELETVVKHFEGRDDVIFLITNADGRENLKKVQLFAKSNTFQLPFYNDESGNALSIIGSKSYPTLVLVDKSGNQRITHEGYSNAEELTKFLITKIETLLAED